MTKPREIPILFSPPMVRAIIAGRKTETRRLVKWPFSPAPEADQLDNLGDGATLVATDSKGKAHYVECPFGGEGDVLWVRESFRLPRDLNSISPSAAVKAHGVEAINQVIEFDPPETGRSGGPIRRRPGMFLPRALARLLLPVRDNPDCERLWSITDEAAIREGIVERGRLWGLPEWDISPYGGENCSTPREAFLHLFGMINGKDVVKANPWVWVAKFSYP